MNKLFSKIAALSVGLAMAVGVGVALGHESVREVRAAQGDRVDTLAGIISGKNYYIRATVSSTDYYWKANGGEAVGSGLAGSSTTNISEATQVTLTGSGSSWAIKLSSGNYLSLPSSKNNGKYDVVASSVDWTVTEVSGLLNFSINGYCLMKNSGNSLNFGSYQSGQTNVWLEEGEASKVLQSIALSKDDTEVKTDYATGESASLAGLTVMATYDSGDPVDVTASAVITANPAKVALDTTSISYTATFGGKTSNSVTVIGITVSTPNPIRALYSKASGASVSDIYGYFVGKLDDSNIVIMDGAYGIDIYKKGAFASISYVENETILKVSGSISIFNGLYEIAATSYSESTSSDVSAPEVYAAKGGETAEYASRVTTVTGTAVVTQGSFDSDAGTADIKMNFTVGTKTIQVFYKKARQTADSEAFAAMKAAVEGGTEITIKGFTGWYNGFQVQMTGYVKPAEDYTAEAFAQDLLNQTDAVCAGWKEGDDNHDALVAIWSNLAAADKYPSLPSDQKTILAEAERDEEGTVIEQAMARYDFLTGKYELSNFINGRTPIQSNYNFAPAFENNNSYIIIIVISAVSVMSFGLALFLRKKRSK